MPQWFQDLKCNLEWHDYLWLYDGDGQCRGRDTCRKCGQLSSEIKHQWILAEKLMSRKAAIMRNVYQVCVRCGKEAEPPQYY